jgi:hypothetical protein
MKRYTTIHPLFMAFHSKSLYRDVGKHWRNISFLYLFLLSAVCLIPIMFRVQTEVSGYLLKEAPKVVEQLPEIKIVRGIVSVNEEMPYTIKDPGTATPLIIIDTTGRVSSLDGSDALVLLTETKLLLKRSPKETRTLDLSEIDNLTIDRARVYEWIETFLEYFIYVLYPFALLISFLFRIAEALVFAAIGMLFAGNMRVSLRYRAALSLAVVSMTPAIILDTLYNFADVNIPFWWFINLLIAMGYLFFAVKANAENAGRETGA